MKYMVKEVMVFNGASVEGATVRDVVGFSGPKGGKTSHCIL